MEGEGVREGSACSLLLLQLWEGRWRGRDRTVISLLLMLLM